MNGNDQFHAAQSSMRAPEAGPVIRAHGLSKRFAGEVAVGDVSFSVPRGEIFGLIGPSGAGKTTIIRMLTGTYRPDAGEVEVLGVSPGSFTSKHRLAIGYMPQHFVLYPSLTVWENLNFAASIYGLGPFRRKRFDELLAFVELEEHATKPAQHLSGGMQRRLSLAAALVHDPALVFLDEPTAGVDPLLRHKFWQRFDELKRHGHSLFVTTQYVGEAAHCDYLAVLAAGRLLAVETPEELRKQAFGGEVIELETESPLDPDLTHDLPRDGVQAIHTIDGHPNRVRLMTNNAAQALPRLIHTAHIHGATVKSIDRYQPSFEEVFVRIIERDRESAGSV